MEHAKFTYLHCTNSILRRNNPYLYLTAIQRQMRKGSQNAFVGNPLPPRLEALWRCGEGTFEPQRPRAGRYRHPPFGHSAAGLGARESLTSNLDRYPKLSARLVRALAFCRGAYDAGSMPLALMIGTARGPARNLTSALAVALSLAAVPTPAE